MRILLRIGLTLFILNSTVFADPHSMSPTPTGDWRDRLREENGHGGPVPFSTILAVVIAFLILILFWLGSRYIQRFFERHYPEKEDLGIVLSVTFAMTPMWLPVLVGLIWAIIIEF